MELLWLITLLSLAIAGNEDKIESKQVEIDSSVKEIVYCGSKKDLILILTDELFVYRSENSGYSWKSLAFESEKLKGIKAITLSKADPKLIGFFGTKGRN